MPYVMHFQSGIIYLRFSRLAKAKFNRQGSCVQCRTMWDITSVMRTFFCSRFNFFKRWHNLKERKRKPKMYLMLFENVQTIPLLQAFYIWHPLKNLKEFKSFNEMYLFLQLIDVLNFCTLYLQHKTKCVNLSHYSESMTNSQSSLADKKGYPSPKWL